MRFKLDENLPVELVSHLLRLGHEADTVESEGLCGSTDEEVLQAADTAGRILLTLDKGIANLEQYPLARHTGVVLFRPARVGRGAVLAFVRERLPRLLELELDRKLTIVGPLSIRSRQ